MLRYLILLVALGAGGSAAWIATQHVTSDPVPMAATVTPTEMTAVLVAARDVPRGGVVMADALRWQPWPADAVPLSAIERNQQPRALQELAGRFANRPFSAGEPIFAAALLLEPGGFLATVLSPGMRAVAIEANTQSTAGGFILPNDRVDVLHTSGRMREGGEVRSRTILRGVRVLAIDQTTGDAGSGTVLGKTATLELTEAQAEAVTAAEATGTLSLSLRPRDEAPGEDATQSVQPPRTIRIHRGGAVEDVVLN